MYRNADLIEDLTLLCHLLTYAFDVLSGVEIAWILKMSSFQNTMSFILDLVKLNACDKRAKIKTCTTARGTAKIAYDLSCQFCYKI